MTRRKTKRACRHRWVAFLRLSSPVWCSRCRKTRAFGPASDDTEAVQDELIAIQVADGERALLGGTSPAFRCGYGAIVDPGGYHASETNWPHNHALWLRQYQSGALAAQIATHDDEMSGTNA